MLLHNPRNFFNLTSFYAYVSSSQVVPKLYLYPYQAPASWFLLVSTSPPLLQPRSRVENRSSKHLISFLFIQSNPIQSNYRSPPPKSSSCISSKQSYVPPPRKGVSHPSPVQIHPHAFQNSNAASRY